MADFPIKGFKEGLLITLPGDEEWEVTSEKLLAQIDAKAGFFKGAKIAFEVGELDIRAAELAGMRDALLDREVKLFAVLSNSQITDVNAESLGMETRKSVLRESESSVGTVMQNGEPAILINRTVRSGASIKHAGHVVVNGDVNPGGEIIASGSIFVWGKLKGSATAGVDGDIKAVVCAMEVDPIQLRIANYQLKINKLIRKLKRKPLKIRVEDENLVYDYWDSK